MTLPFHDLHSQARIGDVRAQVALGLILEARGRFDDGLDWLARAARTGDIEALTLVGRRLVRGGYGADCAVQGQALLAEAAAAGDADAAGALAVVYGLGFHAMQDWGLALGWLQRAAELGRREARAELRILARAGRADETEPGCWLRLRERIDIASWVRPAEGQVVAQTPLLRAFESLAPREACAWIIRQARSRLRRAEVHDLETGRVIIDPERTSRVANLDLDATNLVVLALQQAVARAAGADLTFAEGGGVLCYRPGEQHHVHFDFLDPARQAAAREIAVRGQRIATGLVYLNDRFSDGVTSFPELGVEHRPRAGAALVFKNVDPTGAPDPRSRHAGRSPRGGRKWVLTCFVRDRPQIPPNPERPMETS